MTLIRSLEDLAKAREQALEKKHTMEQQFRYHIQVGMGSCGVAAGAAETWEALQRALAHENLTDVRLTQTGCVGSCALEPIVRVSAPDQPVVTYGRVNPQVARRIIEQHIKNHIVVQDNVLENL